MATQLKTVFPFLHDENFAYTFLLEGGVTASFSLQMKIYYTLVRPILPISLRHLLQKVVGSKKTVNENFIWDEALEVLKGNLADPGSLGRGVFKGNQSVAIVLTHDVEEYEGYQFIPKVIEVERKLGFVSSWNLVPHKYEINPEILSVLEQNGNEIGIHGYNHDGKLYFSKRIFDKRAVYINQALKKYRAVGFRSPMVHRNLNWLQSLDILYDSSCFDYDPLQPQPGGVGVLWPFIAGRFVELPYTLPQDHDLFYMLKLKDIEIWKKKVDFIVRNNGMILLNTHPDYLKDGNHLELYAELLNYLNQIPKAWRCLPKEMATFWKETYGQ